MSIARAWTIALLCVLVGMGLLLVLGEAVGAVGFLGQLTGMLLVVASVGLASNITARRRREDRRQDRPDSVEFQAVLAARSDAFGDAVLLCALAMLALTVAPGPRPMLWSLLLLTAVLGAFWARYAVALRQMRG